MSDPSPNPQQLLQDACRRLADALKQREVAREDRKSARQVLQRAFVCADAESVDEAALALHLGAIAALLPEPESPEPEEPEAEPWQPLALRLEAMWPIRIREALRPEFADRVQERYLARGERLQEVVDWFWERCQPDHAEDTEKSAAEMAMEEFGDSDMEYVWGRIRRPPQS